jgi:glycine/D-amino acid oxidase-like deaminating enzyme
MLHKMIDYIIIGQGLAGSLLAYQLLKKGKKIVILNDESLPTSSQVAGGMFNPMTGKNLSKTWLADELFPFMKKFYGNLETELKAKLFYETNIYRPFVNENQKQQFLAILQTQNLEDYIHFIEHTNDYPLIKNPLGGLLTYQSGWVDVPLMLDLLRNFFIEKNVYFKEIFDLNKMQVIDNEVVYENFRAKKIVFCQGFYATQNPIFNWLRFNPVKGETLLATIENYSVSTIVNQGAWILPIKENLCRFGATYTWQPLDWLPSESEKEYLLNRIHQFLKADYQIIDHQAGIRPATQDRRPFLGKHPAYENVFIFNGLGTKGVSLAPYLAEEMINFMENKKVLHPEMNIERYYALYSL